MLRVPSGVPAGCPSAPVCAVVFERCLRERPELMDAGAARAACWLYDDDRKARP